MENDPLAQTRPAFREPAPYVFARLDELKVKARQQGLDLIDLGMGNPDGATPAPVLESASKAIYDQRHHGYPPFEGTASFRQAIADWYHRRYRVQLDPEGETLPLIGSKEGLTHLALAFVNPGDVVLVPSPTYPAHFRGPLIAGGQVYELLLSPANNWLIDLDAIPPEMARQAKVFYFNYPANPTARSPLGISSSGWWNLPTSTRFCWCMICAMVSLLLMATDPPVS